MRLFFCLDFAMLLVSVSASVSASVTVSVQINDYLKGFIMGKLLENDAEIENADYIEIPGTAEDITEMEKTIDEELNSIFSEFGGDDRDVVFKIRVSRVMKDVGQEEICFYCMPQELPIFDRIKNEYGPGMYKITVFKNNLKFRNRSLNIAKPATISPAPATNNNADLTALFAGMAEMQKQQMEQFQRMMEMNRPAAAPVPQTSLTELIAAMSGLQGMMPKPAENGNMEMLFKGMEIMKDFAGDSGGGREKGLYDMLIEAAKTFGGPIVEMAKNAAPMLPPGAGPVPPGALPAGTVIYSPPGQPGQLNPPPTTAQPEPSEAEQMNLILTMQINNLVGKAAAGADPALYADLILDSMNEVQIREFIGQPDLKGFLISVNPQVETLWPWFEKLQSEVLTGLTTEETPADTVDIIETETESETPGTSTDAIKPSPKGDATADS
jgi:hypothetical protein